MNSGNVRTSDSAILRTIDSCIMLMIRSVAEQKHPVLSNPSETAGVSLELKPATCHRFCSVLKALSDVYALVANGQYSTKRDLYYQGKSLYGNHTRRLDSAVTFVCQLLRKPRISLHVLATAKGFMMGDLMYEEVDGTKIDCLNAPVTVPMQTDGMLAGVRSSARFILIVEKDATFQKLVDEGFCTSAQPCILITGKGYPDLNTRFVTKMLATKLRIPVFALMDADPHGIEIYITYKYGPKKPTFENRLLEISDLKWIGVYRTEADWLPVSRDQFLQLNATELAKLNKLQTRVQGGMEHQVEIEIDALKTTGTKLEIEALSGLRPNYLTNVYLRNKLGAYYEKC